MLRRYARVEARMTEDPVEVARIAQLVLDEVVTASAHDLFLGSVPAFLTQSPPSGSSSRPIGQRRTRSQRLDW
jgi:hypothetical protein